MAETSDLPDAATVFSKRYDRYLRAYLSALGGDTFHARVYAGRFSPELAIEGEDELIVTALAVYDAATKHPPRTREEAYTEFNRLLNGSGSAPA
jgi:hypothetical protein